MKELRLSLTFKEQDLLDRIQDAPYWGTRKIHQEDITLLGVLPDEKKRLNRGFQGFVFELRQILGNGVVSEGVMHFYASQTLPDGSESIGDTISS